jgi:phosphatidylinositol alpha-1,6-mannosyltransferase
MLGIFPSLNPAVFGGVEESGRVAWSGIEKSSDSIGESRLLCYSPSGPGTVSGCWGGALYARTKPGAILAALGRQWPAGTILIWHIDLLQLLPFLRVGRAKVVLFLHGIESWRRQNWFICSLLKRVDLFLSNSAYTWDRFVAFNRQFGHCPHQTIHLGLGAPLVGNESTSDSGPVVVMLGRMAEQEDYKGHREMIHAWRLVVQRIRDAELWIVGSGTLQKDLERVARESSVCHHVRFFGEVSPEKKQELLSQCRCLALPSRGEGFGLVYLEAMRIGKPCLVSSLDAGQEVVNPPEAGLAVNPDNIHEIADATRRLLTRGREWDGFSERARRRYERQFTAAHFQQRLLRVLVEVSPRFQ